MPRDGWGRKKRGRGQLLRNGGGARVGREPSASKEAQRCGKVVGEKLTEEWKWRRGGEGREDRGLVRPNLKRAEHASQGSRRLIREERDMD